ncbi:hypothetical protein E3N88_10788 [Mikania micrantha]|uniref:F-box domain-containing protein n=1 Tax=Mikania micrantha TaxID=192012 RepID=A0A5N6PDV4_9ASTR|nr:hypothetical protein E3N88_10788 [Mikania micrantha]
MEGGVNLRNWADLLPDALGLIFSNLSLQETLTIVPRVCKSWNQAVSGPYCWQQINILDWSYRSNPDHIDHMLRLLVTRSGGALREVTVSGIMNDLTFSFLADHLDDGLWDDEEEEDEDRVGGRLELRFYEGFGENYGNGWV